jgi:outer membrane murein-binding lipoprotein Lpp
MSKIDCFGSNPELQKRFSEMIKEDTPIEEQRIIGAKLIFEENNKLNDQLNKLKYKLKLDQSKHTTPEIKEIPQPKVEIPKEEPKIEEKKEEPKVEEKLPPPPPPETPKVEEQQEGSQNTVGGSHESLNNLVERLGLPEIEKGSVLTPQEYQQRGRMLIENGVDPKQVAELFKKDGKVDGDIISVATQHLVDLTKIADKARLDFGKDSEQYKKALESVDDWSRNVLKPMGTKFSEIGRSLQGETDLDTGSFVSMSNALERETGKPVTKEQEQAVEKLTTQVNDLNKKVSDLENKLVNAINESIKSEKNEGKSTYKEKAKKAADTFRKLKTKEFTFKDENGNDVPIQKMGLSWNDLIEGGAKIIEKTGEIADGVKDILDKVKDADWYKKLSDKDKDRFAKEIELHFSEAEEKKKDISSRFIDKKDNKFELEDVKDIWNYAKENYVDKGVGFGEMIYKVSRDLGLTQEQVSNALMQPKGAKVVTEEMYLTINRRNNAINGAKRWVKEQANSRVSNFFKAVPSAFFKAKTFGHGTVGGVTHAGMDIFQPSSWKLYFPFFIKQFKFAFGNTAKYEMAMEQLKNEPDFVFWKRAGLAVDPTEKYDDYQGNFLEGDKKVNIFKRTFDRMGVAGDRGFNALKWYRLQKARMFYDRLSEVEKKDPNIAKEISLLVNHSTGSSELNLGNGRVNDIVNTTFFAPRLEASRWHRLIIDPSKAVKTFANWKYSTDGQKATAKLVARNAGEKIATYAALLASNAAILSLSGSKQKINFTDPLSNDWLKFKIGGKTLDITGGVLSSMRLLGTLLDNTLVGIHGKRRELRKTPQEKDVQTLGQQARYKFSPFASTIADLVTTTDAMGRPLPFSNIKPKKGETKYTYGSYIIEQQTPIPVSAGIREAIGSMKQRGMKDTQIEDILMGSLYFTVEGFTGAKLADEPKPKRK